MKLIIASNNKHKIHEIKEILGGRFDEILSLLEAGISHETVEDGATFMENARKKAREIAELSGLPTLADDSGLCCDALDGAPGIYSARFAGLDGSHATDEANNRRLLELLSDKADRSAHYTCAISLVFPSGETVECEGYMHGRIIDTPRGSHGFGYDPIFLPDGYARTVAELSDEEKNAISHRGNALRKLYLMLHNEPS